MSPGEKLEQDCKTENSLIVRCDEVVKYTIKYYFSKLIFEKKNFKVLNKLMYRL